MGRSRRYIAGVSVALAALLAQPAAARHAGDQPFLPLGTIAAAPNGFVDLCQNAREPALCGSGRPAPGASLTARDDEAARLLRRINARVNARVHQQSDQITAGVPEKWQRSGAGNDSAGDCEDIAIEKRLTLIAEGFPPDALAFAVVYSRDTGLHTVLVARTAGGDVVLDNRTPYIFGWSQVGYSWVSIQVMGDPMTWRSLARA